MLNNTNTQRDHPKEHKNKYKSTITILINVIQAIRNEPRTIIVKFQTTKLIIIAYLT
jgi:hypothetical protein